MLFLHVCFFLQKWWKQATRLGRSLWVSDAGVTALIVGHDLTGEQKTAVLTACGVLPTMRSDGSQQACTFV